MGPITPANKIVRGTTPDRPPTGPTPPSGVKPKEVIARDFLEFPLGTVQEEAAAIHKRNRAITSAHAKRFQQLVESSRAKPNGVLAIHVRSGRFHSIESDEEFGDGSHIFVYLRIVCIDFVKYSRVYAVDEVPSTIIFDELKHFYINVGSMKPDSFCFVRFEMVAFQESKRNVHRVFASKEISLFQVVKCMYGSVTLELWRDEEQVAEIEIEACFAPGAFGYGYSSLFDIPDHGPRVQLAWSMFCRLAPPADRIDPTSTDEVIVSRDTPRPGIVNFTRLSQLKPIGQTTRPLTPEPVSPLVGGMIGRRLAQRQVAYSHLKTRSERLKYLREFIIHPVNQTEEALISEDVHYFEEVNIRRATLQTDGARDRYSIFTKDPENKTDSEVVQVIAPAAGQAPGVIRRRQANERVD